MFAAGDEPDRSNQSTDNLELAKSSLATKVKSKFFCEGIKEKDSRLEET